MEKEKNDMLDIFLILSKTIIIFPIIVVIVAFIYKFNTSGKAVKRWFVSPTPPPANLKNVTKPQQINIDFKGPLECQGNFDKTEITAYIKDSMFKVILNKKTSEEYFVLNGDCYYRWQRNQYVGERTCGLSPLVGGIKMMVGFGGLNLNSISEQLVKLGLDKKTVSDEAKIADFINNCKKKEIDKKIYEIPKNILFKNIQ